VSAVEIVLKDGTVIVAESYRLNGSYMMLEMADGRHVAYDVADVDLEALNAAEAAAASAEAANQPPAETLSSGRRLKSPSEIDETASGSPTISDRDVKHIRGSGVQGDEEAEEEGSGADEAAGGVPAGFQQGGGVVLNGLRVTPAGEGRWQVEGEVVNRSADPVENVRVQLETMPTGGGEPWRGEVAVAAFLGPNESAPFSHGFAAEVASGQVQPNMRASVIWMRQETKTVPNYGRNAPHPSNLPLNRGSVGGAEPVATPIM
jgi:hypothetical protein